TVNSIPSAVRFGDAVICMSGYGSGVALSLPLSSKGDFGQNPKVNWRHAGGTPYVPSPALVGERLYLTALNDALLTGLDPKTGKVVMDKEGVAQAKSFYASPVCAAGRVYFTDRSGTTLVLKAGDELDVLAANKLDDPIDASPVPVGKQLFLRSHSCLYCIEEI